MSILIPQNSYFLRRYVRVPELSYSWQINSQKLVQKSIKQYRFPKRLVILRYYLSINNNDMLKFRDEVQSSNSVNGQAARTPFSAGNPKICYLSRMA